MSPVVVVAGGEEDEDLARWPSVGAPVLGRL